MNQSGRSQPLPIPIDTYSPKQLKDGEGLEALGKERERLGEWTGLYKGKARSEKGLADCMDI